MNSQLSSADTAVVALFHEQWGQDPEGVWEAPGRVNLIGEHVDYADGLSMPFALTLTTKVAARRRSDDLIRAVSQAPDGTVLKGEVALSEVVGHDQLGWMGYVAGTVWSLQQAGLPVSGMDLALVSDVPLGSGLSSSAALECAVGIASCELALGQPLSQEDRHTLMLAAIRAENEVVGASTGGLDQRASLFCAPGQALLIDFLADAHRLIPCDLEAHGLRLLGANTNVSHSHSSGQYGSRRGLIDAIGASWQGTFRDSGVAEAARAWAGADPERQALAERRVRHVTTEIARTEQAAAALEREDFTELGASMNASHDSLRDDFEVVTPELESAVQAARTAGALGARMTGGGFGGTIIALVREPEAQQTATAIREAAARHGFPEPTMMNLSPGPAARRIV